MASARATATCVEHGMEIASKLFLVSTCVFKGKSRRSKWGSRGVADPNHQNVAEGIELSLSGGPPWPFHKVANNKRNNQIFCNYLHTDQSEHPISKDLQKVYLFVFCLSATLAFPTRALLVWNKPFHPREASEDLGLLWASPKTVMEDRAAKCLRLASWSNVPSTGEINYIKWHTKIEDLKDGKAPGDSPAGLGLGRCFWWFCSATYSTHLWTLNATIVWAGTDAKFRGSRYLL